eukprot:TRINITY_DN6778_c0_g2_i1.p1 TRINITY_DN6778_c0_g2~~TRINITY_DN6778_c0_g2_i1.p1  ORF type:complete len:1150 (+),score=150.52 TRINITY_DN6778_c0_g2_i1:149-3598(+)
MLSGHVRDQAPGGGSEWRQNIVGGQRNPNQGSTTNVPEFRSNRSRSRGLSPPQTQPTPSVWDRLLSSLWPLQSCYCQPLLADCDDSGEFHSIRFDDSNVGLARHSGWALVEAHARGAHEPRRNERRPVGVNEITVEPAEYHYQGYKDAKALPEFAEDELARFGGPREAGGLSDSPTRPPVQTSASSVSSSREGGAGGSARKRHPKGDVCRMKRSDITRQPQGDAVPLEVVPKSTLNERPKKAARPSQPSAATEQSTKISSIFDVAGDHSLCVPATQVGEGVGVIQRPSALVSDCREVPEEKGYSGHGVDCASAAVIKTAVPAEQDKDPIPGVDSSRVQIGSVGNGTRVASAAESPFGHGDLAAGTGISPTTLGKYERPGRVKNPRVDDSYSPRKTSTNENVSGHEKSCERTEAAQSLASSEVPAEVGVAKLDEAAAVTSVDSLRCSPSVPFELAVITIDAPEIQAQIVENLSVVESSHMTTGHDVGSGGLPQVDVTSKDGHAASDQGVAVSAHAAAVSNEPVFIASDAAGFQASEDIGGVVDSTCATEVVLADCGTPVALDRSDDLDAAVEERVPPSERVVEAVEDAVSMSDVDAQRTSRDGVGSRGEETAILAEPIDSMLSCTLSTPGGDQAPSVEFLAARDPVNSLADVVAVVDEIDEAAAAEREAMEELAAALAAAGITDPSILEQSLCAPESPTKDVCSELASVAEEPRAGESCQDARVAEFQTHIEACAIQGDQSAQADHGHLGFDEDKVVALGSTESVQAVQSTFLASDDPPTGADSEQDHANPQMHEQQETRTGSSIGSSVGWKPKGRASSLRERMRVYEAACVVSDQKRSVAPKERARSLFTKGAPRLDARFASAASLASGDCGLKPQSKLTNVTQQRVVKEGILRLHAELVLERCIDVADVPNNLSLTVQGSAFFRRLLSGEVELKSCMEGDVCAVQSDLRHLTVEQLLAIRSASIDLATASATHGARSNFLELVDRHLFHKLPLRCFRGSPALPELWEPLHSLGVRMAVVLGARHMLLSGWGCGVQGSTESLPPQWVLSLPETDWPCGCKAIVIHVDDLWVEMLGGDHPDLSWVDGPLVVIHDRSTGVGGARMLHWEFVVVDPTTDDVFGELARDPFKNKPQRAMTSELTAVLAMRSGP